MATCPAGHSSTADDYCDVCGARIGAASAPQPEATGPGERCPDCGTPRVGRFCEDCGYDYAVGGGGPTPAAPPPPVIPTPATTATPDSYARPVPPISSVSSARPAPPGPGPAPSLDPDEEPGTRRWTPPADAAAGPELVPAHLPDIDEESATRRWTPPADAAAPPAPVPGLDEEPGTRRWTPPEGSAAPAGTGLDDEPATRDWAPESNRAARPTAVWAVVVSTDRDHYDRVVADDDLTFPPYCPERQIALSGPQAVIGRRSVSQGTVPEIDLSEPPGDPGVSHTHAVLLAKPDGTWTLVDPGSTNGTTVNGGDDPIPVNVEVSLRDGDRVHVGVWTTITLRRLR